MMKKRFFVLVLTSLFLIAGYTSASNIVNQKSSIFEKEELDFVLTFIADIYVDDDADPSWYDETHVKTIQEGINNASEGDTIFVYNGTYYESVIVNKSVDLVGESNHNTIVDGEKANGNVLSIYVDFVDISNFTIQNSSSSIDFFYAGIRIFSNYTTIKNNIITKNQHGIEICSTPYMDFICHNNKIIDNLLLDNGIIMWGTSNTVISGNYFINEFSHIVDSGGIFLHDSRNVLIYENHFSGNYSTNIKIQSNSNKNNIHHNNIENNYRVGIGISIENSNFNEIHHNNFKKCLIKATFTRSSFNRWHQNYWGRPRILPKTILEQKA